MHNEERSQEQKVRFLGRSEWKDWQHRNYRKIFGNPCKCICISIPLFSHPVFPLSNIILSAFTTLCNVCRSASVCVDLDASPAPIHRRWRGLLTATWRSAPASRTLVRRPPRRCRCRWRRGIPRRRAWLGRAASWPQDEVVGRGSSRTRSRRTSWNTCYSDRRRPSRCPSPPCTSLPPWHNNNISYSVNSPSSSWHKPCRLDTHINQTIATCQA